MSLLEERVDSRSNAMRCEACGADPAEDHAEIERLNKLNADLFNDLRESQFKVGDKDAEIERLNKLVPKQICKIVHLKDLLTQCADAMEKCEVAADFLGIGPHLRSLLQRVREATPYE